MAEFYVPVGSDDAQPHCVITGCNAPVAADVHADDYSTALRMFRGVQREVRVRRLGEERFFVCAAHMNDDPKARRLVWQLFMF